MSRKHAATTDRRETLLHLSTSETHLELLLPALQRKHDGCIALNWAPLRQSSTWRARMARCRRWCRATCAAASDCVIAAVRSSLRGADVARCAAAALATTARSMYRSIAGAHAMHQLVRAPVSVGRHVVARAPAGAVAPAKRWMPLSCVASEPAGVTADAAAGACCACAKQPSSNGGAAARALWRCSSLSCCRAARRRAAVRLAGYPRGAREQGAAPVSGRRALCVRCHHAMCSPPPCATRLGSTRRRRSCLLRRWTSESRSRGRCARRPAARALSWGEGALR